MRLLHRKDDGGFCLVQCPENQTPHYAILSHTWIGDDGEVTFEDMMDGNAHLKAASYNKILFCVEQAAKDGLEYSWVDTCCINKSSSAELQEAITTMFAWYRKASRCYVYLSDVSTTQGPLWESTFRNSRWFTRGWTLQELIAPTSVEFFSVRGTRLGDKKSLETLIHEITGISHQALRGADMSDFSVTERLSWAENRQTQRKEDKAYSLLGIFGVFMPLIYGEGSNAFIRLQEEIEKKHADVARQNELLSKLPVVPQATFNSLENQHRSTCLQGTRVELLREILEWADGPDKSCIFWLNGIAGTDDSQDVS
ncbi:vegetative incompatibility protein HET-E-1 [Colletotrichum spaethianum]|uniref:Vegetative incompatibility protein HET-E-1 n=1 Tax=Colletotrichum spaethianum TaxID=700344 RepID=A0AA37UJF1_9PEZI|nr:vegetative incompatibility protein HET-E-1 [Colletotrichum spaethianum]GKT47881.1 vegetative incompatibility protein HET-E-1 [Colletotrichum spaethianum]